MDFERNSVIDDIGTESTRRPASRAKVFCAPYMNTAPTEWAQQVCRTLL